MLSKVTKTQANIVTHYYSQFANKIRFSIKKHIITKHNTISVMFFCYYFVFIFIFKNKIKKRT